MARWSVDKIVAEGKKLELMEFYSIYAKKKYWDLRAIRVLGYNRIVSLDDFLNLTEEDVRDFDLPRKTGEKTRERIINVLRTVKGQNNGIRTRNVNNSSSIMEMKR